MPFLTPELRAKFLQEKGYDPSKYSYDEDTGNIYEGSFEPQSQQPAIQPEPALATPGWKVGLKTAVSEALPTAGSLLAGSVPQRIIAGTELGSRLGPWGTAAGVGLGLGSAYLGGEALSSLQNKLLPESIKSSVYPSQEEIAAHPWWNLAGRAADIAPFFSPFKSIESLGRAGSTLKNIFTKPVPGYVANTPAELNALKNTAINTGLNVATQAGLNTAQQLRGNEPFNYGQLARESSLGALFNEPTSFGTKTLGFHPTYAGVPTQEELIAKNEAELNRTEPKQKSLEPTYKPFEGPQREPLAKPAFEPNITTPTNPAPKNEIEKILNDPNLSIEEKRALVSQTQAQAQPNIPGGLQKAKGKIVDITQRKDFQEGQNQGPFKYQEEPQTTQTPTQETPSPQQQSFNSLEQEINTLLAKRGIKKGQYRVVITDTNGKPVLGAKGNPIAGRAEYPGRKVSFGINAGADTGFHEAGHIYFEDLARSSDPRDKELVQKVLRELGHPETVDEYVALNDKAQQGDVEAQKRLREIEEPLMDEAGLEGAGRAKAKGLESFKQWFIDYLSRFGIGKFPASQQFSARLEHEVPFGSREPLTKGSEKYAINKIEVKGSFSGKSQEGDSGRQGDETGSSDSILNQEKIGRERQIQGQGNKGEVISEAKSDYQQYLDVQAKISEKINKGEYSDEEFQNLWKENEVIKNRNGGMPPLPEKSNSDIGAKNQDESKSPEEVNRAFFREQGIQEQYDKSSFEAFKQAELNYRKDRKELPPSDSDLRELWKASIQSEQNKLDTIAEHKKQETEANKFPLQQVEYPPKTEGTTQEIGIGKNQEESQISEHNAIKKKPLLSIFLSATDKIGAGKNDYTHKKVSERTRNFFDKADLNYGRYGQSAVKLFQEYKPKEVQNVYRNEWERRNEQPSSVTLSPREVELDTKLQDILTKTQAEAERLGYDLENFKFNNIDPDVLYAIDQKPTSIEARSALRKWREWLVSQNLSEQEANALISSWQKAHRNHGDIGGSKIEQYGLPWDLVDKNPARAMLRYGRKVGNKLAYYEYLQRDPEMQKALGINDQEGSSPTTEQHPNVDYIGGEKEVRDVMSFAYNLNKPESPRLASVARAVGNLVMGPGTAIRNLVTIPANLAPYDVKFREFLKGLSEISNARTRAYESGAARVNPGDYEFLSDVGNPDKVIRTMDKMSSILRKWQGRDASDRFEGTLIYSIGEEWAKTKLFQAARGDANAKRLLERVTGRSDYGTDVQEIAKGLTNVVRGSYGPQGLPAWMITGNLAPFVALNKYSVEKWNNVYKDVVTPLKNGNALPFFKYTLAGLGIGYAIEQLNEALTGRTAGDLNVKEALAAYAETQDPEILASKVIGLAQMASYAGVVGDMAKLGIRGLESKSLTYNNPLSFPLYTLVTQTLMENISGAAGAIKNDEDPIDVLSQFVKEVAIQSSQAGRYIEGNANKEDQQRKEEFADIRKYEEATGRKTNQELGQSKPNIYEGAKAREFKRETDIGKAASELPELINEAFKKAGNDPYRLKSEFRKLKQNQYRTMPSLADQPLEFFSYLEYLRKSKGDDVASERLSKFLSQGALNKAKAQLVP